MILDRFDQSSAGRGVADVRLNVQYGGTGSAQNVNRSGDRRFFPHATQRQINVFPRQTLGNTESNAPRTTGNEGNSLHLCPQCKRKGWQYSTTLLYLYAWCREDAAHASRLVTLSAWGPPEGKVREEPGEPPMLTSEILNRISRTGVIAVLVVERVEDAVPLAKALLDGGIDIMELTLRTPAALDAVRVVRQEVPEMMVGAGTVLTVEQVQAVAAAGAAFGVAPGMNRRVVTAAESAGLPFMPGVLTPSDVEQALECDCRVLKFFPAEPIGGLPYLKSMAAPYAHLDLRFIPLGGLSAANARAYLEYRQVLAVGGSWIAKRELIERRDWKAIIKNAQEASHARAPRPRMNGMIGPGRQWLRSCDDTRRTSPVKCIRF